MGLSLSLSFSLFWASFYSSFRNFNFILQCPRASEEHEPLSSHHGAASTLSAGLLVDTNLGTSPPDTYRPPHAPIPYDVNFGHPQTPPAAGESCGNKNDTTAQTTNSGSLGEVVVGNPLESLAKCEDLKQSDCKLLAQSELTSSKETEVELSKSGDPIVFSMNEEDVCPTCLEGCCLTLLLLLTTSSIL